MLGRNAKCAYNFSRETEGKKPVLRPTCIGRTVSITIIVKENVWVGVDWVHLVQGWA